MCSRNLLSILSSKVLEKASISFGGRSRINQIVSFKSTSFQIHFSGSVNTYIFPTFVQSVAKSLFSASTHFFVIAFKSEDLPAFVYHTIQITGYHFFILLCLCKFLIFSNSLSLSLIFICFSFKCLFILSVFVSPSHLVAPLHHQLFHHCLLNSIHIPKILGHICLIAASSIWSFASTLSACLSKILRIKSILSQALICSFNPAFSLSTRKYSFISKICPGFNTFQIIKRFAQDLIISCVISSNFHGHIYVLVSG